MKFISLIALLISLSLQGQVKFDKIFNDHMVLQAGKTFAITGKGIPGHEIQVTIHAQKKYHATVNADSIWTCNIIPQKPSDSSFDIIVSDGDFQDKVTDVIFGDVWLCAGQSNMEFPLSADKYVDGEKSALGNQLLRLYNPNYVGKDMYGKPYTDSMKTALKNGQFYSGVWESSNSNASLRMSAIGYYFGKILSNEIKQPIGIINLSVGGSPIESWLDRNILKQSDSFSVKADSNWIFNDDLPVWVRQRATENVGAQEKNSDHAFKPGYIYEHGIELISKLPIKGILWYQGESNAQEMPRVIEYPALLRLMISDYRKAWSVSDLPFYIIQLSSIDTVGYKSKYWPAFRQLQYDIVSKKDHIGIVPTHDLGNRNNVHPNDKKTVATRLSNLVLHDVYQLKSFQPGPLPIKAIYRKHRVVLSVKTGLGPLKTMNGKEVKGFSLDGIHGVAARIKNKKIIIDTTSAPQNMYYSILPFSDANVIDGSGNALPAFKLKVN